MKWMNLWHKLKWKYVLISLLCGILGVLFFYNLYIRNQIEEALFEAFSFIIGLITLPPLILKLFIFISAERISKQCLKEFNEDKDLLEVITIGIAAMHNKNGATAKELIVDNIVFLLHSFGVNNILNTLEINDDFTIFTINGKVYKFKKYFKKKKDDYIINRRMEIDLLYRDSMDLKEIIKMVIETFNNEIKMINNAE